MSKFPKTQLNIISFMGMQFFRELFFFIIILTIMFAEIHLCEVLTAVLAHLKHHGITLDLIRGAFQ